MQGPSYNKKGNINEIDLPSLLNEAVKQGIINISDVQEKVEMTERENYLNLHKQNYKTWQGADGKWRTYLPDESKKDGRRLVKKVTEEKLNDAIVDYYQSLEDAGSLNKISLDVLFPEWLEYKQLHTNSTASIRRISDDWNRYYKNSPIIQIPLIKMTYLILDEWAHKMIKQYGMTKKQYYNMSIIMRQSLVYAEEKNIIPSNPFKKVHIDGKLFRSTKKPDDEKQVFLINEQPLVEAEAYKDFEENGYCTSAPLAIPFLFQTGLRLGELVALRVSDIEGNYIHIQRQEVKEERQREDGGWLPARRIIVDYTKSEAGDRMVYLSSKARQIVKKILDNNKTQGFREGDYIFLDKKGRIHGRAVDTRLRKYCRCLGMNYVKSCHDIRRTYISILIDKNININEVRKQAGHADERTTYRNYCYNRMDDVQKEQALESALCG